MRFTSARKSAGRSEVESRCSKVTRGVAEEATARAEYSLPFATMPVAFPFFTTIFSTPAFRWMSTPRALQDFARLWVRPPIPPRI